jgi:hypothetical protein
MKGMKKENNVVYKITNIITNKSYIGVTSKGIQKRWEGHLNVKKNKSITKNKFYNALYKYDEKYWDVSILFVCFNKEDIYHYEKIFIKEYDTFKNGYNSTTGGDKGWIHTEENIRLIKERKLGTTVFKNIITGEYKTLYVDSKEAKSSIWVGVNKDKKVTLGTKRTKEQKENISDSIKEYYNKTPYEETSNFKGYFVTPKQKYRKLCQLQKDYNISYNKVKLYCFNNICKSIDYIDDKIFNCNIIGKKYSDFGWYKETFIKFNYVFCTPYGCFATPKDAKNETGMAENSIYKWCNRNTEVIKKIRQPIRDWAGENCKNVRPIDFGWYIRKEKDTLEYFYKYHTPFGIFDSIEEIFNISNIPKNRLKTYFSKNTKISSLSDYDEFWVKTNILGRPYKELGWDFEPKKHRQ